MKINCMSIRQIVSWVDTNNLSILRQYAPFCNYFKKSLCFQVDTPSPSPMETSGCAPAEEYLCQAFSDVILAVSDVDAEDGADPNLCSEYVKDIYAYLRQLEEEQAVKPKYLMGHEVTGNMRAILIDWLVQVQIKFRLLQETMYMTVSIIDRFMQDNYVPKKMLQLVGVTAMFAASKYEEMYPPEIGDFAFMTDNTYTKFQIRQMEMKILRALNFSLGRPLPLHFLRRASKIGEVQVSWNVWYGTLGNTAGHWDLIQVHYIYT